MEATNIAVPTESFFYQKDTAAVGPFDLLTLRRLKEAGLINDDTAIRREGQTEWESAASLFKRNIDRHSQLPPSVPPPVYWFYLDEQGRTVGPIAAEELQVLRQKNVISETTLIASEGCSEWVEVGKRFPHAGSSIRGSYETANDVRFRELTPTTVFTLLSLGLYWILYLIPSYTRDLEAITRRPRIGFAPVVILAVITLGIFPCVLVTIYAFELEKLGKERGRSNRQNSLGLQVLSLLLVSFVLGMISGGLSFLVSVGLNGYAAYILQKEINLYATAPAK